MEKIPHEIFKAYDIRGIVETQLTVDIVEQIGQALGTMALQKNVSDLVVGYDGRLTSPKLAKALTNGILQSGCNVFDIGEVTTPVVYFANYELKTYSGIMITGSHNPPEYNGLKMVIAGETLAGDKIQLIRELIEKEQFNHGNGTYHNYDVTDSYLDKITNSITLNRKIEIVIDCGNGVAGKFAPKLYRRLGCKVLELFCEVDGNFPNHHPDPSQPHNLEDLINALKNSDAEFGLAFDGDGDRLGVVTKEGNIIYPDRQMMLYAADILEKYPKGKIIYDVKSSGLLIKWIKEHGGEPIMCRTGHSFIKAKIKETGAVLAGEMSGHLFFNDKWYGVDDGVYAGARLIEILSRVENPSALLNALPNAISTPEINITVKEGEQHRIIEELKKNAVFAGAIEVNTLDGLRVEYANGFGLVRASNTTPVLVLRFESESRQGIDHIQSQFKAALSQYIDNPGF